MQALGYSGFKKYFSYIFFQYIVPIYILDPIWNSFSCLVWGKDSIFPQMTNQMSLLHWAQFTCFPLIYNPLKVCVNVCFLRESAHGLPRPPVYPRLQDAPLYFPGFAVGDIWQGNARMTRQPGVSGTPPASAQQVPHLRKPLHSRQNSPELPFPTQFLASPLKACFGQTSESLC